MLLARNVRKARWDREALDGSTGPCADALTGDLATTSDKMSWWIIDDGERSDDPRPLPSGPVALDVPASQHGPDDLDGLRILGE